MIKQQIRKKPTTIRGIKLVIRQYLGIHYEYQWVRHVIENYLKKHIQYLFTTSKRYAEFVTFL
jgi:hypothetical protein